MERMAARTAQGMAGLLVLLYVADYGAMKLRVPRDTAFLTVTVHRFLETPLKGRKAEYDFLGDAAVTCSRSIFPQGGDQPCWWVRRHTTVWE